MSMIEVKSNLNANARMRTESKWVWTLSQSEIDLRSDLSWTNVSMNGPISDVHGLGVLHSIGYDYWRTRFTMKHTVHTYCLSLLLTRVWVSAASKCLRVLAITLKLLLKYMSFVITIVQCLLRAWSLHYLIIPMEHCFRDFPRPDGIRIG